MFNWSFLLSLVLMTGLVALLLWGQIRSGRYEFEQRLRRNAAEVPGVDSYRFSIACLLFSFGGIIDLQFDAPWAKAVGVAGALGLFATIWRRRQAYRKLFEDVRAAGYRVCCDCLYDLRGHPDDAACPECGAKYSLEGLRETWEVLGGRK